MTTDPALDLEWYGHQIQGISKDLFVSQITRGQVPGRPPFLILHLKAVADTVNLTILLEKWKAKNALEIFFDVEQIEEDELLEYQESHHALVGRHTN